MFSFVDFIFSFLSKSSLINVRRDFFNTHYDFDNTDWSSIEFTTHNKREYKEVLKVAYKLRKNSNIKAFYVTHEHYFKNSISSISNLKSYSKCNFPFGNESLNFFYTTLTFSMKSGDVLIIKIYLNE